MKPFIYLSEDPAPEIVSHHLKAILRLFQLPMEGRVKVTGCLLRTQRVHQLPVFRSTNGAFRVAFGIAFEASEAHMGCVKIQSCIVSQNLFPQVIKAHEKIKHSLIQSHYKL